MKVPYSKNYVPAAPVLEVTLVSAAENRRVGPLTGIVDSGADGTLVPLRFLSEIQAPPTSELFLRSQWGERRPVWLYLVDVQIGSLVFPGVEVVGDDVSGEIVVGRDVLSRLRIILDGPQGVLEFAD
jgi:hypothetical protein